VLLGLLSDTHDNLHLLQKALAIFRRENPDVLIHCGDITQPETLAVLNDFPLHCAFGNMDVERDALRRTIQSLHPENEAAPLLKLSLDGHAIAVLHGDKRRLLDEMIHGGQFAYVLHGHTHQRRDEMVGVTRVINPGALSRARWGSPSCALLDLARDDLRVMDIQP